MKTAKTAKALVFLSALLIVLPILISVMDSPRETLRDASLEQASRAIDRISEDNKTGQVEPVEEVDAQTGESSITFRSKPRISDADDIAISRTISEAMEKISRNLRLSVTSIPLGILLLILSLFLFRAKSKFYYFIVLGVASLSVINFVNQYFSIGLNISRDRADKRYEAISAQRRIVMNRIEEHLTACEIRTDLERCAVLIKARPRFNYIPASCIDEELFAFVESLGFDLPSYDKLAVSHGSNCARYKERIFDAARL